MPHAGIVQPHIRISIMDKYMHSGITGQYLYIINNILSCTFDWLLLRGAREAVQESRKRRRRGREVWVGQRTASSAGKRFTVLYLYQSVCQSSALLQRNEGEEQEDEKKELKRVKDSGTTGRINHKKKPRGNSRKKKETGSHVKETNHSKLMRRVDVCEEKKRQQWDHSENSISERRRRLKTAVFFNSRVLEQ